MQEEWVSQKGAMKRLRRRAFERQGGLCYWCKQEMILKTAENASEVWNHPRVCTGDHLVWKARGGKLTEDNIVAACGECNFKRHPPLPELTKLDWPWLEQLVHNRVHWVGWGPW